MNDIEIPRARWWAFCEAYSQANQGKPVEMLQCPSASLRHAGSTAPMAARFFSGQRIFQEVREAERSDTVMELMVTVWEGAEEISFLIKGAIALYSRSDPTGRSGLRVDCADGTSTLIQSVKDLASA